MSKSKVHNDNGASRLGFVIFGS